MPSTVKWSALKRRNVLKVAIAHIVMAWLVLSRQASMLADCSDTQEDVHVFFSELKRRNVLRVALAYLALAWLLIQVAAVVVPAYGLPLLVVPVVVTLFALGLPLVLVFSRFTEGTESRRPHFVLRLQRPEPVCFRWTKEGPEGVEIVDYH